MAATKILVVDDAPGVRALLRRCLEGDGYGVIESETVADVLTRVHDGGVDLITLDLNLGGESGIEIARLVRQVSDVPIIMVTGRGDVIDRVVGLELGADDYMTKPFNPRELVARVKAILRRSESGRRAQNAHAVANLAVDKARREARVDDRLLSLRTKEFDLLVAFVENPGIALTRDQLLESVWGYDYAGETRTVDVHVQHLRSKLTGAKVQIETLRGVGYKLIESPA